MSQVLAAEGGYQLFTLGSSEWFLLYFCARWRSSRSSQDG